MEYGFADPLNNSASVATGVTISRTITGLTRGFEFLLQVQATASGKNPSELAEESFTTLNAFADEWELVGQRNIQAGDPLLDHDETLSSTPSPIPTTCPVDEQEALTFLENAIDATTRRIGHVVRVTRIALSPGRACIEYYFAAVGVNKHNVRARLITSIGNVTADFTIGNTSGSIGLTPTYQTIATNVSNGVIFSIQVPQTVTFDNSQYGFVRWRVNGNFRPIGDRLISGSIVSATDLEAEYEVEILQVIE
jgi:hypothetical protein